MFLDTADELDTVEEEMLSHEASDQEAQNEGRGMHCKSSMDTSDGISSTHSSSTGGTQQVPELPDITAPRGHRQRVRGPGNVQRALRLYSKNKRWQRS